MTKVRWNYRAGAALAAVTALLICWMNLAVGIAGAEDNPVNLSFFGLAAVAAVGSFAAEFRAKGMARTMYCTAAIQLMLGLIVATGPVALDEPAGPTGLFALNAVFALSWIVSGALLAQAARWDDMAIAY
ncbi:hypothetical protein P1X14_05645 [Sphingomonas sp. AOB5]|uniref:hypothetical protein n=1 Tax=Sphingomonas sp. AOB5 TaxID=3034017 RepID=UPI0023FA061C|nr:hypothetical protein [Sphingomonas sp. AOB5]MDF7774723.1 hypothetical protein [Sphingomonas sp. AOB5]